MPASRIFRNSVIFALVFHHLAFQGFADQGQSQNRVLQDYREGVTILQREGVDSRSAPVQRGLDRLLVLQLCAHVLASPLPAFLVYQWSRPPNVDPMSQRIYQGLMTNGAKSIRNVGWIYLSVGTMLSTVWLQAWKMPNVRFKPLQRVLDEEKYGLDQIASLAEWAEVGPNISEGRSSLIHLQASLMYFLGISDFDRLRQKVREWLASAPEFEFERKVEENLRERDRKFPHLRANSTFRDWLGGDLGEDAAQVWSGLRLDHVLLDSLHAFLKKGKAEPINWDRERSQLRENLLYGKPP